MSQTTNEESAVRNLLQQVLDAWAHGDGRAFASTFTDDGDVIFFDGSHLHGRQQITVVMQQVFDTALKGSRCHAEVKAIRFLTPDIVLMQTLGGALLPGESAVPPERFSIQTFVVTKTQGIWSVVSFQNTRIQPTRK